MKNKLILVLLNLLFLCMCCKNGPTKPADGTLPPIANAGSDQTSFVGSYIVLDPSASTAGDGDTLIYSWATDSSNPVQQPLPPFLKDPVVGFTAEGTYLYILTVNNGRINSAPDTVVVQVGARQQQIFTDPKLEITVRYKLSKPIADLSNSDLSLVDTLQAANYYADGITSLAGIEPCKNIVWLGCTLQKIKDISPLSTLTNLRRLSLSQNREIEDISPLANLINLHSLNLESNKISDISELANLTKLRYLNLMYNSFSDISAIENMMELEELYLSCEPFGDVSKIANLTKLQTLWIPNCNIYDISSMYRLNRLRLLYISDNHINDIGVLANFTELEELFSNGNSFSDLSALKNLIKLNYLRLSNNNISNIRPIVDNVGIGNGDVVNLRGNPLDSISVNEYIPALRNRGVLVFWP